MIGDFGFLSMLLVTVIKQFNELLQRNDGQGEFKKNQSQNYQFHGEILPEEAEILRKQRMDKKHHLSTFDNWLPEIRVLLELSRGKAEKQRSIFLQFNNPGLVSALPLTGLAIQTSPFPGSQMHHLKRMQFTQVTFPYLLVLFATSKLTAGFTLFT